jgi:hypothetical protein
MIRALVIVVTIPVWTALAWATYKAAKWLAAFLATSEIDQVAMAFLAVIIVGGVIIAAIKEGDW